ncbi:hypothetical protein [Micromonospora sagamiensis]|uniref:Uncharacterized protein n=1 Tax=Micromonospora sagamiensis TaxID=47875 RepID=A0A562WP35_9ACTN|nr:hypothetical protein [Micromonospora sagamiensis]TWJ32083.1 hypothetical protein JD81_05655 [Micromonospora sagamiensis]BCL14859.1 hypothetical protein GCM10017556_25980 [Micromonospora sagamiensis]
MTAGRFGEVDHDLLADYVGGALDGTTDETTVARLVAEDPAWARAHDELAAAMNRVGAALAAWGGSTPTMPETVADRLTAALAGAGPAAPAIVPAQASPSPTVAVSSTSGGESSRTVAVVGASPRPAGRGRRRWSRRTAPVLVAAAAMVAAGFGVTQFVGSRVGQPEAGSARDTAVAGSAPRDAFRLTTAPTRTGTSYTPDTVGTMSGGPGVLSNNSASPARQPDDESEPRVQAPVADLDRLTDRTALDTCLGAVGAAHGRGRITVDRVEYAAFQGAPALVIGLVDAEGDRWVVVTGPECGVPGSGADTRYRAQVG